jgi:8-oxo-dGTP diphosphatase
MPRTPVLAAGGIVLRQEPTPLIAVVRLRKRNEWVLPKGKLNDGETPRHAAEREVLEETGHEVTVHEFLGTLVYDTGRQAKVVHYWRMEPRGGQTHELMDDVRAVDWLPLDAAVERLSRGYERAFLANVGPLALEAAALAELSGRPKPRQATPEKRRTRQGVATESPSRTPIAAPPQPDPASTEIAMDQYALVARDVVQAEAAASPAEPWVAPQWVEAEPAAPAVRLESGNSDMAATAPGRRGNLVQKIWYWLAARKYL